MYNSLYTNCCEICRDLCLRESFFSSCHVWLMLHAAGSSLTPSAESGCLSQWAAFHQTHSRSHTPTHKQSSSTQWPPSPGADRPCMCVILCSGMSVINWQAETGGILEKCIPELMTNLSRKKVSSVSRSRYRKMSNIIRVLLVTPQGQMCK